VYCRAVTGFSLAASIVSSVSWPAAVVVAVVLLRRELAGALRRLQSVEFPGGKATFAALADYGKVIAAVVENDENSSTSKDEGAARRKEAQFSVLEALADASPRQAIIDAWGLLEYQLNVASDRLAPDQPHGWPQVTHNLEGWAKWPIVSPAILELRRLRDYTVHSSQSPSSSDAARYVSVVQDLVTTLRTASVPAPDDVSGDEE
jgi:hypothetical protein